MSANLEQVKDLQFAFKEPVLVSFACRVVQAALVSELWPDEVSIIEIENGDKNCVGSVYRWLMNAGILQRTSRFRRSKATKANGRTIFSYSLASRSLAETFLRRHNQTPVAGQIEMSL